MPDIPKRLLFSIGLLSVAIIAFQLVLMQILSIMQWYHFAYMVISVALLGFGAAGTVLSIFRERLLAAYQKLLPLLMILSGATMAVAVGLSQLTIFRFDSYLLFADVTHVWKLLITYFLFFIPFFSGALAIGIFFAKFVQQIGALYFANLIGSGIGGIAALLLMGIFFPEQLPAIIAIFPIVSGILILPAHSRSLIIPVACFAIILLIAMFIFPTHPVLSQFKSLRKTLDLPEARIVFKESSPYGLIQVVSSPAIRYAPGLSLTYQEKVPVEKAAFNNGNWFGPVISREKTDTTTIMDYTTNALPYAIQNRDNVLVLNAGTGADIAQALIHNAKAVTAVEPNTVIISMLENDLAAETDSLFHHPAVSIEALEPRTYLLTDTTKYDLITLPIIGGFGGTSGLQALQEQYLLTRNAFGEMWRRLTPQGMLSVTCWMDYPVRNPLKILATIVEVLEEEGIENPSRFITAVRSWGTITFALKRTAITEKETRQIRQFCRKLHFDPALLPDLKRGERDRYNQLQDDQFFEYLDKILSPQREQFYQDYAFTIRPATDNRPYFSQFLRWKSIPHLSEVFGGRTLPFLELGYLIVALTLVQITLVAIVLIILPLFKIGWRGGKKGWIVLYFSGIGLGFMFVEIVLIQRFTLYFGNPIYAASAVISTMMIFSGIGSYFSSRLTTTAKTILMITTAIIFLLLLYALVLTPILQQSIALPLPIKILLAILLIAIPTTMMGNLFPLGLRIVSHHNQQAIPWAWGINGCLSVISSVLATLIAVEMGFYWVMIFAALAYGLPLVVNLGGGGTN